MINPIRSRIESLESRIAPAGIVTVDFTGGALTLIGDGLDNVFSVAAIDLTTVELAGSGGTLFQVGGGLPTADLRLTAPIKSITADFAGGTDEAIFTGLKVSGDINVTLGEGNNEVEFRGLALGGALNVTGGSGADEVSFSGSNVTVKKSVTLNLGGGNNEIEVAPASLKVAKDFTFTAGLGSDIAEFGGGLMAIGGNAIFELGDGVVVLAAPRFTIGKSLLVDNTGSVDPLIDSGLYIGGTSGSIAMGNMTVNGNVTYLGGTTTDELGLGIYGQFNTKGTLRFDSGSGSAAVSMTVVDFRVGRFEIDASASSDLGIQTPIYSAKIPRGIQILGGAGNDNIEFQVHAGTFGTVDLQLGEGTNASNTQFVNAKIQSITVTAGGGSDTVTMALAGTQVKGSVDIQTGTGKGEAVVSGLNAVVGGLIRMENGVHPGVNTTLTLDALGSQSSSFKVGGILFIPGDGPGSTLTFSGVRDLTVKGSIAIQGGSGNDQLFLEESANFRVGKGFDLALGEGTNSVTGFIPNLITSGFKVTGGAGNDNIDFAATGSIGAITMELGAGTNIVRFEGAEDRLAIKSVNFVSTALGGQTDALFLFHVNLTGALIARMGAGVSNVDLRDSLFGGAVDFSTGAGMDDVRFDAFPSRTGVIFAKPVVVDLGEDNDSLVLGGNSTSALITTRSTFRANGGNGTDTLTNPASNIFKVDPEFTSFE